MALTLPQLLLLPISQSFPHQPIIDLLAPRPLGATKIFAAWLRLLMLS
jgi:hypothetical protein